MKGGLWRLSVGFKAPLGIVGLESMALLGAEWALSKISQVNKKKKKSTKSSPED